MWLVARAPFAGKYLNANFQRETGGPGCALARKHHSPRTLMGEEEAKAGISKRKQTRYAVTEDCRIRASISIRSSDASSSAKDWCGTLVDMSWIGPNLQ